MEYAIGEEFYSEENDSWYRVVRGRHNSCKGCILQSGTTIMNVNAINLVMQVNV